MDTIPKDITEWSRGTISRWAARMLLYGLVRVPQDPVLILLSLVRRYPHRCRRGSYQQANMIIPDLYNEDVATSQICRKPIGFPHPEGTVSCNRSSPSNSHGFTSGYDPNNSYDVYDSHGHEPDLDPGLDNGLGRTWHESASASGFSQPDARSPPIIAFSDRPLPKDMSPGRHVFDYLVETDLPRAQEPVPVSEESPAESIELPFESFKSVTRPGEIVSEERKSIPPKFGDKTPPFRRGMSDLEPIGLAEPSIPEPAREEVGREAKLDTRNNHTSQLTEGKTTAATPKQEEAAALIIGISVISLICFVIFCIYLREFITVLILIFFSFFLA